MKSVTSSCATTLQTATIQTSNYCKDGYYCASPLMVCSTGHRLQSATHYRIRSIRIKYCLLLRKQNTLHGSNWTRGRETVLAYNSDDQSCNRCFLRHSFVFMMTWRSSLLLTWPSQKSNALSTGLTRSFPASDSSICCHDMYALVE